MAKQKRSSKKPNFKSMNEGTAAKPGSGKSANAKRMQQFNKAAKKHKPTDSLSGSGFSTGCRTHCGTCVSCLIARGDAANQQRINGHQPQRRGFYF
jgi:hypothetical protein